jgi:hypothetical protein
MKDDIMVWLGFLETYNGQTLSMIQTLGRGVLLCKMDLSNAFRLLPNHPSDFCLLGIHIDDKYYIGKCMPFGCSIACSTFAKKIFFPSLANCKKVQ